MNEVNASFNFSSNFSIDKSNQRLKKQDIDKMTPDEIKSLLGKIIPSNNIDSKAPILPTVDALEIIMDSSFKPILDKNSDLNGRIKSLDLGAIKNQDAIIKNNALNLTKTILSGLSEGEIEKVNHVIKESSNLSSENGSEIKLFRDKHGNWVIPRRLVQHLSDSDIEMLQGREISDGRRIYFIDDEKFEAIKVVYVASRLALPALYAIQESGSRAKENNKRHSVDFAGRLSALISRNIKPLSESSEVKKKSESFSQKIIKDSHEIASKKRENQDLHIKTSREQEKDEKEDLRRDLIKNKKIAEDFTKK